MCSSDLPYGDGSGKISVCEQLEPFSVQSFDFALPLCPAAVAEQDFYTGAYVIDRMKRRKAVERIVDVQSYALKQCKAHSDSNSAELQAHPVFSAVESAACEQTEKIRCIDFEGAACRRRHVFADIGKVERLFKFCGGEQSFNRAE